MSNLPEDLPSIQIESLLRLPDEEADMLTEDPQTIKNEASQFDIHLSRQNANTFGRESSSQTFDEVPGGSDTRDRSCEMLEWEEYESSGQNEEENLPKFQLLDMLTEVPQTIKNEASQFDIHLNGQNANTFGRESSTFDEAPGGSDTRDRSCEMLKWEDYESSGQNEEKCLPNFELLGIDIYVEK